jgi:hypothetical protein
MRRSSVADDGVCLHVVHADGETETLLWCPLVLWLWWWAPPPPAEDREEDAGRIAAAAAAAAVEAAAGAER